MDEEKGTASMAVDLRKYRIRIHKPTLASLGPPAFIQLLVNPTDKIIAVRGLDKRCKEAHVVSFTRLKPDDTFELYSKQLVLTLMSLLPELNGDCTYRLTGEIRPQNRTAFFPLSTIRRVEEGCGWN